MMGTVGGDRREWGQLLTGTMSRWVAPGWSGAGFPSALGTPVWDNSNFRLALVDKFPDWGDEGT